MFDQHSINSLETAARFRVLNVETSVECCTYCATKFQIARFFIFQVTVDLCTQCVR